MNSLGECLWFQVGPLTWSSSVEEKGHSPHLPSLIYYLTVWLAVTSVERCPRPWLSPFCLYSSGRVMFAGCGCVCVCFRAVCVCDHCSDLLFKLCLVCRRTFLHLLWPPSSQFLQAHLVEISVTTGIIFFKQRVDHRHFSRWFSIKTTWI